MNDPTLLARVMAQLDARRDPFDDAEVLAWLDAHPEALALVATLRAQAHTLAASRPVRQSRARRLVLRSLSAAFLAAAVALVAFGWHREPAPPAGRIFAASLEVEAPRAHLAATYRVRESLVDSPHARLEQWQQRSEPR